MIGLPIEEILSDIRSALGRGCGAVIEAPPGAGKTTVVPLALLGEPWLAGQRIIMLEPRRLAARAAAMRMAELLGEKVGLTVGYRTRLDTVVGPRTRVEVVTEGVLTRFLQSDPSLEGVGCVIFDEYHERSLNADLGLALALESRSVLRPDLRIVVMSATLDGREVSALIGGAPVFKSFGRTFPVEVRYQPRAQHGRGEGLAGPSFISSVTGAVLKALKEEQGGILVFLPGGPEIRRAESALRAKCLDGQTDVAALYGDLSKQAQDRAMRPAQEGRRKVVLATSIAETSLTIDGVRVVIDGGLKRVQRFSPSTGMSRLETVMVTRDSAEQRSGRAGRTSPGVSVRLWNEFENAALRDRSTPEILEADLVPLAMELAYRGIQDPGELSWIDPPPASAMGHACEVLKRLGAIDASGRVTLHGRKVAGLALHPRLAHMVLKAKELGSGALACYISALLTERDFLRPSFPGPGADSDIRHRLDILTGDGPLPERSDYDPQLCERIKTVAARLKKSLGISGPALNTDEAGALLAFAYLDRIAKRRPGNDNRYILSNGRGACFRRAEPLAREEYIVAASLDGGDTESTVFLAAPVTLASLEGNFSDEMAETSTVEWDQGVKGVLAVKRKRLWGLVISEARIENPCGDEVLGAFLEGIRKNGLGVLPWDNRSGNLLARIRVLCALARLGPMEAPAFLSDFSDETLLDSLPEWLGPWLSGMTRLEHLKKLDMAAVISGILSREQNQALDKLVPTHLVVPSGSRIALDYSGGRPVLAVRLQELFGLERTPAVASGKLPVLLHLLSPAGRPVQVTEDLAGFWASVYGSVKKELKGRYPKHHWPDDPITAEPARGAKRRSGGDKK